MVTKLKLANFKAFGNPVELDIKPITILCGTNSSGKSSVMQSMLMLKQTFDSKKPDHKLMLNGRFVQLGSIEDIVYNHDKLNVVTLSFENKSMRTAGKIEPVMRILDYVFNVYDYSELNNMQYYSTYEFNLSIGHKRKKNSSISPIIVESIKFKIFMGPISNGKVMIDVNIVLQKGSLYKINIYLPQGDYLLTKRWKSVFNKWTISFSETFSFVNLVPKMNPFPKSRKGDDKTGESIRKVRAEYFLVSTLFDSMHEGVQDLFSSYRYIGPVREAPARRYIYEEEVNEIGVKGENAAYLYQEEENKKIKNYYLFEQEQEKFALYPRSANLSALTRRVLESMGIKNFGVTSVDNILRINLNSNSSEKTKVNIADVGFGVSQIFPIVLEGLRMNTNDTLMLEQPEIHLHPNLQMQLADYLISLALSNKNIIVETHSDHFINRLVRRVVEDKDKDLSKLIQIYFIKATEFGSEVETVKLDSRSGISNWPEGFFDQNMSEQQRLLQAIIAKEIDGIVGLDNVLN